MSSKTKWKESSQKARSFSQTSSASLTRKTSLLDEDDLSFSDDELEQYLGTIKKKSGLNRLWTGNTFDRVIDRTPDVSISSVSDGEVPIDEEDKNSDNDFHPNILAFPSVATEDNNSEVSEPSSIKPFQAVNLLSDLELSEAPLEAVENVIHREEAKVIQDNDIKTVSHNESAEEVLTLDEISEEIEEDLSQGSKQNTDYSKKKDNSQKDSMRSERSNETDTSKRSSHRNSLSDRRSKSRNDSRHSRSSSKSKHRSQYTSEHSSLSDSSKKQKKTRSRHSRTESSKHSQKSSKKSEPEDSYTTDFSEYSKQTKTESSKNASLDADSPVSSTKVTSVAEMSKTKSKHKMNRCYHDVGTQVNMDDVMDDVSRQKLGVGMATLGPSLGHRYIDPSPIARHAVSADAVEAVTAYNPAVIALTDMLRQQLRLVEQFVDNSRRMYESYTNNLNTTYRYTTLEDTLQYIEENREGHTVQENLLRSKCTHA